MERMEGKAQQVCMCPALCASTHLLLYSAPQLHDNFA